MTPVDFIISKVWVYYFDPETRMVDEKVGLP
jgi:hypothetical protein